MVDQYFVHDYPRRAAEEIAHFHGAFARSEQVLNTLTGHVIPEIELAAQAVDEFGLVGAQFGNLDTQSLQAAGLGDLIGYAGDFTQVCTTETAGKGVPPLNLLVAPRMLGCYVGSSVTAGFLYHQTTPFCSAHKTGLPVLRDPREYSEDELRGLEGDSFAQQVIHGLDLIRSEDGNKHKPVYSAPPRIIRALGILPVPSFVGPDRLQHSYDFTPGIYTPGGVHQGQIGYDAQMLVRGDRNPGGNYVTPNDCTSYSNSTPVHAKRGNQAVPLSVDVATTRPAAAVDEPNLELRFDDLTFTPRAAGALAVYLFPHNIHRTETTPAPLVPLSSYSSIAFRGGSPAGGAIRGVVGGANIGVSSTTAGLSANKVSTDRWRKFEPAPDMPVVYILQLLTVQRTTGYEQPPLW